MSGPRVGVSGWAEMGWDERVMEKKKRARLDLWALKRAQRKETNNTTGPSSLSRSS